MKVVNIAIDNIKPYSKNPRINDNAVDYVARSIKEFGFKVPIVIDKNNVIVAGHTRYKASKQLRLKEVPCIVADDLTSEQIKAFRLADNKVSEFADWDIDLLNDELDDITNIDMSDFGFDELIDDIKNVDSVEDEKNSLADRFLVPPFSIIDTRKGEWQKRKKAWFDIGLNSFEGREEMKASGSAVGSIPNFYDYKQQEEKILGKKLTTKEFTEKYLDKYIKNSQTKMTNDGSLLSIFDPVLCEVLYYWFTVKNSKILDPFAGGSVRGIVASKLGHKYVGVDLREEQIIANKKQAKKILNGENIPNWICGNSVNIDKLIDDEFDFVFSCPPYFDLEVYSDNKEDLRNQTYEEFLNNYSDIINKCINKLKEDRFACFVVGEVRNKKTGFYRNLVADTIKCFEKAGASFYNEIILVNPIGSARIRASKAFLSGRKISKIHQNILVFYKGNTKNIKKNFPEIEIDNSFLEENFEEV